MTDRTEPLGVVINAEDRLMAVSGSLLARFLLRELESSAGISELLALFDGAQQSVARRLAARTTAAPSGCERERNARRGTKANRPGR
jgi:hypothetical protein